MRVLIAGGSSAAQIGEIMESIIEKNGTYLFTVVTAAGSKVDEWAKSVGAPTLYVDGIDKAEWYADTLVAIYDGENQMVRKLINDFGSEGKHGIIVRVTS